MKPILPVSFGLCLAMLFTISGCTTASNARTQAQAAFAAGQQSGAMQQQKSPSVFFRGDVKNPSVPWVEDMTLAQGLLSATYTGMWDPHTIVLIRKGETFKIDPKSFLRGTEDPPLEPGDIVEIHR